MLPLFQGFILGASICGSIGPQSLFVLRQGIRGEAALLVAVICILIDFAMIAIAITGAERVVARFPDAGDIASWGAAAFIFAYACLSLVTAARRPSLAAVNMKRHMLGASAAVVVMTLAVSLLNPQVYIEMMVMVGVVGLQFASSDRLLFGIGVAMVSPLWFFALAFGGRRIAPWFARPEVCRAADLITGLAMIVLALVIVGGDLTGL
jgi:L-lysine exporter family protein LysE/ArgO